MSLFYGVRDDIYLAMYASRVDGMRIIAFSLCIFCLPIHLN